MTRKEAKKLWAIKNSDKIRAYRKKYLRENKEAYANGTKERAKKKRCYLCNKIKPASKFYISNITSDGLHGCCKKCSNRHALQNQHKRLYGITPKIHRYILKTQGGVCAICKKDTTGTKKKLALDHNHKTGHVRGILCDKCNLLIGYADDDIKILKSAIKYLKESDSNENKYKKKIRKSTNT